MPRIGKSVETGIWLAVPKGGGGREWAMTAYGYAASLWDAHNVLELDSSNDRMIVYMY